MRSVLCGVFAASMIQKRFGWLTAASVFIQTDAAGKSSANWRLDIHDIRITWMGFIPHSRNSQVRWLEAKCSGNHAYSHLPLTMGHYTREDLSFYYALPPHPSPMTTFPSGPRA